MLNKEKCIIDSMSSPRGTFGINVFYIKSIGGGWGLENACGIRGGCRKRRNSLYLSTHLPSLVHFINIFN